MKQSRIVLLVLLVLALLVALVSCADDAGSGTTDAGNTGGDTSGGTTDTGNTGGNTTGGTSDTGDLDPSAQYLEYLPLPDGTWSVPAGQAKLLDKIVIPAAWQGKAVTAISERGFMNCTSLTSVTIPEGVTSIGERAFSGCYKLAEVYNLSKLNITAGSENYGYVAYYAKVVHTSKDSASKLKTDANGYLFYENGDEAYLIGYTGTKTDLILPEKSPSGKAYSVNTRAFYGCTSLTSITIPSSVTSIGDYAFV